MFYISPLLFITPLPHTTTITTTCTTSTTIATIITRWRLLVSRDPSSLLPRHQLPTRAPGSCLSSWSQGTQKHHIEDSISTMGLYFKLSSHLPFSCFSPLPFGAFPPIAFPLPSSTFLILFVCVCWRGGGGDSFMLVTNCETTAPIFMVIDSSWFCQLQCTAPSFHGTRKTTPSNE